MSYPLDNWKVLQFKPPTPFFAKKSFTPLVVRLMWTKDTSRLKIKSSSPLPRNWEVSYSFMTLSLSLLVFSCIFLHHLLWCEMICFSMLFMFSIVKWWLLWPDFLHHIFWKDFLHHIYKLSWSAECTRLNETLSGVTVFNESLKKKSRKKLSNLLSSICREQWLEEIVVIVKLY